MPEPIRELADPFDDIIDGGVKAIRQSWLNRLEPAIRCVQIRLGLAEDQDFMHLRARFSRRRTSLQVAAVSGRA